jgi:beta-lactamase superfamily II metal-dependent hydrolase
MPGIACIRVWDVEHGCCVMLQHIASSGLGQNVGGRLAMIDSGSSADFQPSTYLRDDLGRDKVDYLFITNADQDHMSDLQGLEDAGIKVGTLFRNRSYTADQIRDMKLVSGPLTRDATWYVNACRTFNNPVTEPFNENMGGITCRCFWNKYPDFTDTNNLSLAVFIKFGDFKMLLPGDLERPGWLALLGRDEFCAELAGTNVLMASHHGRKSGFCDEIFDYFTPDCVVISDKPIVHTTQEMVPDYRAVTTERGVYVRTTGKKRHVLTTRRDGWIMFAVDDQNYDIDTEYKG